MPGRGGVSAGATSPSAKRVAQVWEPPQNAVVAGDGTAGGGAEGGVVAGAAADAGRRRVAAAARAFDQGAIYEYTLTQGAVARRTLGVGMAVDETTFMRRMPYDELLARRPDLVGLPWAGPSDGGVLP